jgi:glycosyltransferase involved in cell wall biosynthesis
MKVLHTLPFTSMGGPALSVPSLMHACSRLGVRTNLIYQRWPQDDGLDSAFQELSSIEVPTRDPSGFGYSAALRPALDACVRDADIIHSHSLWMYMNYASGRASARYSIPHVIAPRGTLEPWALARSRVKKWIAGRLFQARVLESAACIHALTDSEAQNIRRLGVRAPLAVIPNGVRLPDAGRDGGSGPTPWDERLADRRVMLYLGRLHPKKGLLPLVEAWAEVVREFPEWHLVFAGPGEGGYRAVLEREVAERKVGGSVSFVGNLGSGAKSQMLRRSDAFVLPSFSEGFSMAVLEAMSFTLPMLITPGCNFPEATESGAAHEIMPDRGSIMDGLRTLLSATDAERRTMGEAGRALVSERYTWDAVAARAKQLYDWLNGAERPDFVMVP